MTAYTTITNSEIDTDSPVTESLMTRMRDNPIAITEGSSGAPAIQTAALEQTGGSEAVTAATIRADTITATEIAANAVHQSELYTLTSEQTASIGAGSFGWITNLTGGLHTIGAQTKWSVQPGVDSYIDVISGNNSLTYVTHAKAFASVNGATAYVNSRYVSASPPYDLGDGDFDYFLLLCVASNGDILGTYSAPDPAWFNNGKNRINIVKKEKTKNGEIISYTSTKDMSGHGMPWEQAKTNQSTMEAYIQAFNAAPEVLMPITREMKNTNMDQLPHPFAHLLQNNPGASVVMLDPFSNWMIDYKALREHDEFTIGDIIEYIDLSAPESTFKSPGGVVSLSARFK